MAKLLLCLLILHLRLLELHTLLLEFVVLKLARTLLGRVDATKESAGNGLDRRNTRLAVGRQNRKTRVEQAATDECLALVVASAWSGT